MRWGKIVASLIGLAVIGAGGFFFGLEPERFDRSVNALVATPLPAVSQPAQALHQRLTIVDLHADPLLWRRDLTKRHDYGHIDFDRMADGHMALQVFSSVTKTPRGQNYDSNGGDTDNITILSIAQLQPPRTWFSLLERSVYHAQKLNQFASESQGSLRVIHSQSNLAQLLADRARGQAVMGGLLSVEGLQNLEGKLDNVDRLYEAGFRMLGLAHFFDNEVAGSVHGLKKYGLTPLGRRVIQKMEQRHMIVDVAHSSHAAIHDVLAMATRPVVFSHGGVKGTCNNNRNLTDEEIRGIAATGGLIGIGYWEVAVCEATPKGIARSIRYVRDLVGIEHVSLGSDWDGAVTAAFDTAHVASLTQALMDEGLTEAEIADVMGGNALRLFQKMLPPQ